MRVYDCKVSAGSVTVTDDLGNPVAVPDAVLMSAGVSESSGKLIISEDGAIYIVNTQPDLQTLIDKVSTLTEQVAKLASVAVSRSPDSSPLEPQVAIDAQKLKSELEALTLI